MRLGRRLWFLGGIVLLLAAVRWSGLAAAQESVWERDGLDGRAVRALVVAPETGMVYGLTAGPRPRGPIWQHDTQGWVALAAGTPDLVLALAGLPNGGLLVGAGRDVSDQPGVFQVAGGGARRIYDSQAVGALAVLGGRGGPEVYAASAPWADRDGAPELLRREGGAWSTVLRGTLLCPAPSYFKEIVASGGDAPTLVALEWCRASRLLQTQLWRSDDRGLTWQTLPLPGSDYPLIATVALDPSDSSVLYLAGLNLANGGLVGLERSLDGGQSWTLRGDGVDGLVGIRTLLVDPRSPRRILAGTERGGAFASDDRGESWRPLPGLEGTRIWQLAIDEATGRLYAATSDGIWRMSLP